MDGWAEGFSGLEMLICRRWHRYVVPLIDIETLHGKAEVRMDDGKDEYLLHRYKIPGESGLHSNPGNMMRLRPSKFEDHFALILESIMHK